MPRPIVMPSLASKVASARLERSALRSNREGATRTAYVQPYSQSRQQGNSTRTGGRSTYSKYTLATHSYT